MSNKTTSIASESLDGNSEEITEDVSRKSFYERSKATIFRSSNRVKKSDTVLSERDNDAEKQTQSVTASVTESVASESNDLSSSSSNVSLKRYTSLQELLSVYNSVEEAMDGKEERRRGEVLCPAMMHFAPKPKKVTTVNNADPKKQEKKQDNKYWAAAKRTGLYILSGGSRICPGYVEAKATTLNKSSPSDDEGPNYTPLHNSLKHVVVIGIHGWAVLGGVLGSPKPVSEGFCRLMTVAFARQLEHAGIDLDSVKVCLLPLYGHGCVKDRVNDYLKGMLQAHVKELMMADQVLIACHSQGAVVSNFLLWEMITQKRWLNPHRQHIAVLSMAGIHLGPYPDTRGDFHKSTAELFQFSQSYSDLAIEYLRVAQFLLQRRVKIMTIGSFNDEVVPMFSACMHPVACNPNLVRGLYFEQKYRNLPRFIASLFSLVFYMNNSNEFTDVLVHLSGFFRGSVLSGKLMHSEIHRDQQLYDVAAKWFLSGRAKQLTGTLNSHSSSHQRDGLLDDLSEFDEHPDVEHEVSVHTHSLALYSSMLTDTFIMSDLNCHMLSLRIKEMLVQAHKPHIGLTEEIVTLRMLFQEWTPRGKAQKVLKDTLEASFGPINAKL